MPKQQHFYESEEVRALHSQGLDLSKADFDGAQAAYSQALDVIRLGNSGLDELSLRMQAARILRDDGFVHIRRVLDNDTKEPSVDIAQSLTKLFTSQFFTQLLKDRKAPRYSPEAWRFVRSEHGATLGLIGRLATVAYVLDEDVDLRAFKFYQDAHEDLTKGSNRYYETSNAINAARQLVLERKPNAASIWRGRAYKSLKSARKTDPDNYLSARLTYNRRKHYLKNVKTAENSVRRDP